MSNPPNHDEDLSASQGFHIDRTATGVASLPRAQNNTHAAETNDAGRHLTQAQLRQQAHSPVALSSRLSLNVPSAAANRGPRLEDLNPSDNNHHRSSSSSAVLAIPEYGAIESPSSTASSGWSHVETNGGMPPSARSLHAAAVLNGCLYVFGGYDGQSRVNTFHAFSFAEKRWSPVLPSSNSLHAPSPRDRHVAFAFGNSFYVQGGFDGSSRVSDFWSFNFSSMSWREVEVLAGRPPSPRHSHAAVVYRDSVFLFGGYDGSYKSDLHEFNFTLSQWNVVPAAGRRPRSRYRATADVHKNMMILYGGHDGTRHLSDTFIFDFDTRTWSALITEGTPPIPRDSHISVVHSNSMYIFGGSSGSALNDLYELQLPTTPTEVGKWRQVKTNPTDQPSRRFCHVGAVHHESMYIFGGYDGAERLNDFVRFDFAVHDMSVEVPPPSIIQDLRALVDEETLSDVTFIVEGTPVYAHKLMLMRCSYFRALLLGEMKESKMATIRIEQVSHPIFLQVLEYLYTDALQIPFESAMELFEAADLFCIPRLKTMCEKRMLQSICIENAAGIFHASDMHSALALRDKAKKFILSHFEAVSKTTCFEEMGRCNIELVFELLQSR